MSDNFLLQFKDTFINEVRELLTSLEQNLLELEKDPENKDQIKSVFRVMHTLKGVCAMYGYTTISEFTHVFESIYQLVSNEQTSLTKEIFDITFNSVDHIANLLDDPELENNELKTRHEQITYELTHICSKLNIIENNTNKHFKAKTKNVKQIEENTWYIVLHTDDSYEFRCINLVSIFFDLSKLGTFKITKSEGITNEDGKTDDIWRIYLSSTANLSDIEEVLMFILDDCIITKVAETNLFENSVDTENSESNQPSILETAQKIHNSKIKENNNTPIRKNNDLSSTTHKYVDSRISVTTSKLDTLMFLVSELVTTKSELILAYKNRDLTQIGSAAEKIEKLSKLFRDNALNIRLVPINDMLLRFKRLARDLTQSLNKKIDFIVEGAETELDKKLIDTLGDPLMHLIRNCIDHGIEIPQIRKEKNKPETGILKFTARQEGNAVILSISDDGKGINPDVIRNKAIEKGIISAEAKLSLNDIYNLIFIPGFSTAESLTQVSGRGVGMDVVKTSLAELGAEIQIYSEIDVKTEFVIKLQQSIAIIDTMLFQSGDLFFMIPVTEIEVCSLIETSIIESRNTTNSVPFYNELIPYIDLFEVFNIEKTTQKKLKLIIIKHRDTRFAIAAETIVGEHQAVLKTLGKEMQHQDKIAGASVLGDGNLAYLLELNAIKKLILTV